MVEQLDQVPDQPGLGLAPLTQQDQVVTGQDAALQGGQHGFVEPDDRGEQRLAAGQPGQEVLPELFLDRPVPMVGRTQLTDRSRAWQRLRHSSNRVPGNSASDLHAVHGRSSVSLLVWSGLVGNNETLSLTPQLSSVVLDSLAERG